MRGTMLGNSVSLHINSARSDSFACAVLSDGASPLHTCSLSLKPSDRKMDLQSAGPGLDWAGVGNWQQPGNRQPTPLHSTIPKLVASSTACLLIMQYGLYHAYIVTLSTVSPGT
jgi:hypothetical protein